MSAALIQAGTAAALGALTTGRDYQLRIEPYRSLNLDWAAPLAAVLLRHTGWQGRWRWLSLARGGRGLAGWRASRTPDLLGELDLDLPCRAHPPSVGGAADDGRHADCPGAAAGPQVVGRWAWLGWRAASLLERLGQDELAAAAALVATVANALMLAAFRQPERPLALTASGVGRCWGWAARLARAWT